MIEVPPAFRNAPLSVQYQRVNGKISVRKSGPGQRLAEDVRRYSTWMRAEAVKHIGHLYPKIEITPETTAASRLKGNYWAETNCSRLALGSNR